MALKRKRSAPSFSSPAFSDASTATSTTTTNTNTDTAAIPFFYPQSKPVEPTHQKQPTWSWPTYDDDTSSAQHLNSRTRKRHRDDRPDEQAVYGVSCWIGAVMHMSTLADVCRCAASTISKLYEAQRRHPNASPVMSAQSLQPAWMAPNVLPVQAQKSTLHSFWRIPSAPVDLNAMQIDAVARSVPFEDAAMRCEDCERPLQHDNDAMELDSGMLEQETACAVCKRQVCDTCAVLGHDRICLSCASGR
ncbi:hypothetical protein LTR36_001431 [Oleoguttula mirabilis]|uniref:Uncharacterized protein n=1 Tax=Oleoguttula mirabilis TaxID=1507867 RepID=A0AAV9JPA6_9PEZI|nr:hypothetical protein LTR36_001431 [Oleoguttula mirabilis]